MSPTLPSSMGEQKILEEELDPDYEPTEAEVLEYAEWLGMDPQEEKELLWISRHGLVAKLPAHWKPCQNEDGQLYYFNFENGQSVWEHPCDTISKKLFEKERTKLLNIRAAGGIYSPRECSSTSQRLSNPASSDGQPTACSQHDNLSQSFSNPATDEGPTLESQCTHGSQTIEASNLELKAERPLTTLSDLAFPEEGAVGNSQKDDKSNADKNTSMLDMVEPMPVRTDAQTLPSGTPVQVRQSQEASRAAARMQYDKELQLLEEEFQHKLQARKASLEQAEEDLLAADKQARLQLVERRKRHQADMHALHQSCKEELEKSRTELEQENAAALTQLQVEMQNKLANIQTDMQQQLDKVSKEGVDIPCPQGTQFSISPGHQGTAGRPGPGKEKQEGGTVHSTQNLPCAVFQLKDFTAEQSRLLQPISMENSENFPPVVVEDVAAPSCTRGNSQSQIQCLEGRKVESPKTKSAVTTPDKSTHTDTAVSSSRKTNKQHKKCRAPFPEAHDTCDEGNEHLMKRKTCAFLKEQKRLIQRRQAAMHRAREEWQRNAEILEDVYPDSEREELVRVLTQVHQTLEDQAKHLNQDSEQLALIKERLASGSFHVSSPPAMHKSLKATERIRDRGGDLTRSVKRHGITEIPAFSHISVDHQFPSSVQDKSGRHAPEVDAENLLESHALWLRSLREKITKVSRPGGRTLSVNGRQIGVGSLGGTQSTPVNVRVGHDRELVIRVQSSALNSP